MPDIKQDTKAEVVAPKAPPKVVIPKFDQYINVVLSKENYEVVKEAITKSPDKLEKIIQYVNELPQEQLKEVFSRPVF